MVQDEVRIDIDIMAGILQLGIDDALDRRILRRARKYLFKEKDAD